MTKARDLADLLDASGNIIAQGTIDGRDIASDGSKLDSIEHGATGDQTHSEIRALITAGVDTNVFTDADHSKLDGIEAGATADQTAAEIKTAYESNANTNEFSDAEQSKLAGIETGATGDQTASEIRSLVEAATDSNVFTDADHSKLNGIEAGATADQTKADIDALNVDADTLDGQHGSYYTSYADTAVANIVDSAPGTLDTLNELAAALGDDPNFATTTATNIGTKANKTITVSAGSGLTGGGDLTANRTISHADTSSQASVDNSNGTVIQDITLDTYGHITGISSANLDGRYYTETEADSRFVNVTGDTMSGTLTLASGGFADQLTVNRSDGNYYSVIKYANTTGEIARMGFTETGLLHYRVGTSGTNKYIFHDDYHPNADKWTTARTLSLSGDASGSVSWDGSGNATLSVTVANDSHTHTNTTLDMHFNRETQNIDTYDPDSFWATSRGTGGTGNYPTSYVNVYNFAGNGSNEGTQLATYYGSNNRTWIRSRNDNNNSWLSWSEVWTSTTDGSGSGLDADLLDGVQGSSYLRSDTSDNMNGSLTIESTGQLNVRYNGTDSYRSTLDWQHLQLGNNGQNSIIAGRTNGGGYLSFFVNNTTDVTSSTNGTEAMRIHANSRVSMGAGFTGTGGWLSISSGSAYPIYLESTQRYMLGLKNTSADANYIWLVHDTRNSRSSMSLHFNGVGDRFHFEENGNFTADGTVSASNFTGNGSNLTGIDAGAPAGSIIYHAGSSAPSGYIKANGASLGTSAYAALFSAIGYTYGGSGGSFNVPDLRGEFIRGWDDSRGVDSGRSFGSSQLDQMQRLTGGYNTSAEHFNIGSGSGVFNDYRVGGARNSGIGYGNATRLDFDSANSPSARVSSSTSGETRPRNIALLACIKY